MKPEVISLSGGGTGDGNENQSDVYCLSENEAIAKVTRKKGGKGLCFTDENGTKLYVNFDKKGGEVLVQFPFMKPVGSVTNLAPNSTRALKSTYNRSCGCICDTSFGEPVCINPYTGLLCTHF